MHEPKRAAQAGFSMIEMLITAFILAVGLLGLAMFQTMSLRASRGSRSVNTAVMVAEQIMDQAEMEGRLSWLNVTDSALTNGTLATLTNIKYLNIAAPLTEYFNSQGGPVDTTSADPALNTQFFTAVRGRGGGQRHHRLRERLVHRQPDRQQYAHHAQRLPVPEDRPWVSATPQRVPMASPWSR